MSTIRWTLNGYRDIAIDTDRPLFAEYHSQLFDTEAEAQAALAELPKYLRAHVSHLRGMIGDRAGTLGWFITGRASFKSTDGRWSEQNKAGIRRVRWVLAQGPAWGATLSGGRVIATNLYPTAEDFAAALTEGA